MNISLILSTEKIQFEGFRILRILGNLLSTALVGTQGGFLINIFLYNIQAGAGQHLILRRHHGRVFRLVRTFRIRLFRIKRLLQTLRRLGDLTLSHRFLIHRGFQRRIFFGWLLLVDLARLYRFGGNGLELRLHLLHRVDVG